MPVWIYTLATYLRPVENLQIKMFDARTTPDNELPTADLYLFTGINQDYQSIFAFLKKAKAKFPASKFILGGPICWSYNQAGKIQMLYEFDHLIIGDGEPVILDLVQDLLAGKELPKVIHWNKKFELEQSRTMDRQLLDETIHNYYGAVIEVSRGCPFLCEFCDIRIQKDNNRPHNKPPETIVAELDYFARKGVKQILFACDNFIGDAKWAESVCDAIIKWSKETGQKANLYTWLTINLAAHETLMAKLRDCGFDMFFIGVESFEQNQLLETAKIQNVKTDLVNSITKIQSYGFIVVAGLIFGFDTEPDYVCDSTLDGILKSGLISGEPSLLTALPGTPLYKRMKYSGRLREAKLGLGGYKYQTNIKYLKPKKQMVENFQTFVRKYNTGKFQYERFKTFCKTVSTQEVRGSSEGYINVKELAKMAFKKRQSAASFGWRLIRLISNPERSYYLLKAILLVGRYSAQGKKLKKYFYFWLFVWSNSVIKFENLGADKFDIESVEDGFNMKNLVPAEYLEQMTEEIPEFKIKSQRKLTVEALKKITS